MAKKWERNLDKKLDQKIGQTKIQQKIGQEIRPKIGQKIGQEIRQKCDKKLAKNIGQKVNKKLVRKIKQNIREEIRQNNGEEQSLILYKVSQDKLNKNSRIGKISKNHLIYSIVCQHVERGAKGSNFLRRVCENAFKSACISNINITLVKKINILLPNVTFKVGAKSSAANILQVAESFDRFVEDPGLVVIIAFKKH